MILNRIPRRFWRVAWTEGAHTHVADYDTEAEARVKEAVKAIGRSAMVYPIPIHEGDA